MSNTLHFKVFCFEIYKSFHGLTGKKAMQVFKKYGVFSYLNEFYDVLHTTGKAYIIESIDEYINTRQKLA